MTVHRASARLRHQLRGSSRREAAGVAHLVDGALKPAGSVGSGLTHETARALWTALEAGQPVVMDVEFRGWTPAGELRHAVFKGWHKG
jgi:bifunctional non-homologous end joining protein LigD